VADAESVWKGAVLLEDYKGQQELHVQCDDGKVCVISHVQILLCTVLFIFNVYIE
jgi:hypothetical protein